MLDIRTRIRTDLNPSKRIWFRIRSENIRTVFIPSYSPLTFCTVWRPAGVAQPSLAYDPLDRSSSPCAFVRAGGGTVAIDVQMARGPQNEGGPVVARQIGIWNLEFGSAHNSHI